MPTKQQAATFSSAIILAIIVWVALRYRTDIFILLREIDLLWFGAGLVCYCCNYGCRAYRIWFYAGRKGSFLWTYPKIAGVHGFNSYFLPLRGGDLTLPLLLRLHVDIPVVQGGKILVRARLLDIFLLGFLLLVATFLTTAVIPPNWRLAFSAVAAVFILLPYILIRLARNRSVRSWGWIRKFLGDMQPSYPGPGESMLSLVIWFWTGSTIFCVIRSLGIPLSYPDVWFLATVQLPLQFLPVQGLANSGNHEAGWIITLGILGISADAALPMAISSHIIIIFYVVTLGAVAALLPAD